MVINSRLGWTTTVSNAKNIYFFFSGDFKCSFHLSFSQLRFKCAGILANNKYELVINVENITAFNLRIMIMEVMKVFSLWISILTLKYEPFLQSPNIQTISNILHFTWEYRIIFDSETSWIWECVQRHTHSFFFFSFAKYKFQIQNASLSCWVLF